MNISQPPLDFPPMPPGAAAVVGGEAVARLPESLYVPPDGLRVFLDSFAGPMDLLLHLVRRHKIDAREIPMVELCRQYHAYAQKIAALNLERAGDYLLMAATLLEVKTKTLLPRAEPDEEGEEDPRADLARRLLEYERIRAAALALGEAPRRGRDFAAAQIVVSRPPPLWRKPRLSAYALARAMHAVRRRARIKKPYRVEWREVSLREVMGRIARLLSVFGRARFSRFIDPGHKRVGATLLALLHLAANRIVSLAQTEDGDLRVTARRVENPE